MQASFKREFDSLDEVFGFVRLFFRAEGIDPEYLPPIDLAVEEIFTNMVKYNRGARHEIDISLEKQDDKLTIALIDHEVEPFDITKLPDVRTDQPVEERRIGGLGIHLVRKLMDEVDYDYVNGRSTITLVKRIESQHV